MDRLLISERKDFVHGDIRILHLAGQHMSPEPSYTHRSGAAACDKRDTHEAGITKGNEFIWWYSAFCSIMTKVATMT